MSFEQAVNEQTERVRRIWGEAHEVGILEARDRALAVPAWDEIDASSVQLIPSGLESYCLRANHRMYGHVVIKLLLIEATWAKNDRWAQITGSPLVYSSQPGLIIFEDAGSSNLLVEFAEGRLDHGELLEQVIRCYRSCTAYYERPPQDLPLASTLPDRVMTREQLHERVAELKSARLRDLFVPLAGPELEERHLVHTDFQPSNMIVDPGCERPGVLVDGHPRIGHRGYDWGRGLMWMMNNRVIQWPRPRLAEAIKTVCASVEDLAPADFSAEMQREIWRWAMSRPMTDEAEERLVDIAGYLHPLL